MKRKLPGNIEKSCALCEYAKKVSVSEEILCARTKNLKKVEADYFCRKFSFDILSYKPDPAKLPKFVATTPDDIL